MSEIRDKLQSLLAQKGLMSGAEWRRQAEELAQRRASGEFEIDKIVPGEVVGGEDEAFYLVRTDLPLDTPHGNVTLGEALLALPEHVALSANDSDLRDFSPETALFLDTETTGLAGGSGTVAFLVGAGYFEGGMFRLEQAFMRDFDDEEPMLRYLDGVFTGRDTVVSYNGKSFDIPLLRTRFIQNRIPFRLDGALQYDLLHAARRFWKRRLGDCGLTNIEREVLGVRRHGDVSSAEIPELWLEYLRTRDARPLEAVFYHHKMDVLSLAALAGRLSQSLNLPQGTGFDHLEDRLSLVRLHFMQKNYQEVTEHGRRLLEEEAEVAIRCECLYLMGMACKRLQQWVEMEDAWTLLLAERPRDLVARLELAKYYEHRVRDLLAAERICEETLQFLETRSALGADELPLGLETFRVRLERIQRKLGRM
ncbi:MAG TPA: ribonuclease H-like domain-containing protein [Candidatus Hydrogenedentes bacterium]|nr:ribonuclease H-like domain-containing protein [Candidatus Hydrogenedentota bacterium]